MGVSSATQRRTLPQVPCTRHHLQPKHVLLHRQRQQQQREREQVHQRASLEAVSAARDPIKLGSVNVFRLYFFTSFFLKFKKNEFWSEILFRHLFSLFWSKRKVCRRKKHPGYIYRKIFIRFSVSISSLCVHWTGKNLSQSLMECSRN